MYVGENIVFHVWKTAILMKSWTKAYFVLFVKELVNAPDV